MFWVPEFWLSYFEYQNVNFESHIVEYVCCFKLADLKFGTSCIILMFNSFFYSNISGYSNVVCKD
jgi:hypothetical protein